MKSNLAARNQMLYRYEDIPNVSKDPSPSNIHLLVSFAFTIPCRPASSCNSHSAVPKNGCQYHILCSVGKQIHNLLTDPLPAILALDGMFDD